MKVAFLGLGAIGAPMARHLAPRYTLSVWNRTATRSAEFAKETTARAASSPADAVRGAVVAITCLPTSREVESLLDGEGGMLGAFDRGATLVDCTSGDPATSRRIAARLAERGVGFIDAPVSGGVSGAVKGILTIMCGGDEATMARARPILEAFGEKIVLCGPIGAGHAVKAVNQAMLGVHIWSLAEGLVALQKAGVSTATALDVINSSSGRSNTSMNLFPERVMTRAFPRTFRLALMDKDVRIAADFAREHGVTSPLLQLASELLREARRELGEEADHVETVQVLERWAGVQLGKTP
ncbi:MAG TPA: NAD(P)-dependent oxidoreductase [Gemmatimonadaceae bacterium]